MSFRVLAFFTWIFTVAALLNVGVADQFRTSSWAPLATISDSISSATTVAPAHSVRWLLKATSTDTGTISSATELATTAAPVVLEGRADSTDITGNATAMSILNNKAVRLDIATDALWRLIGVLFGGAPQPNQTHATAAPTGPEVESSKSGSSGSSSTASSAASSETSGTASSQSNPASNGNPDDTTAVSSTSETSSSSSTSSSTSTSTEDGGTVNTSAGSSTTIDTQAAPTDTAAENSGATSEQSDANTQRFRRRSFAEDRTSDTQLPQTSSITTKIVTTTTSESSKSNLASNVKACTGYKGPQGKRHARDLRRRHGVHMRAPSQTCVEWSTSTTTSPAGSSRSTPSDAAITQTA